MSTTIRRLASRIYDRLFRAPRGFGRPVPANVWNRDFADGRWAHLSDIAEATRYAIVHNYVVRCKSPATILDIGCGAGVLRERFSEAEVERYTGIDVSQEAIRIANAKGFARSTFVVANFDEYLPEVGYDVIVFNESIGYASDPGETFGRFWKVLSPGGICVVSLYDFDARSRAGWKRIERVSQPRYSSRHINEKGQAWDIKAFVKAETAKSVCVPAIHAGRPIVSPGDRARVCLVTALHPSLNPRLVKEADALSGAGYDVSVIAARFSEWGDQADAEFAGRPWRIVERPAFGPRSPRSTRLAELARRVFASTAVQTFRITAPGIVRAALHPVAPALASAAKRHRADLYIGHLAASLPAIAIAAAHHGSRYAFDAEDFHIGNFSQEREMERRLTRLIEERYLPGATYVTAAAPMIAEAYREEYGIKLPATVLNVFPLSQAPGKATPRGVTAPGPSIYWISQTIGPRRGLECAVRAISLAKAKPHLYLRGNPAPGFVDELQRIAGEAGSSGRVHVLPRAVPSEMERIAATYDIGLAGEVGDTLNHRLALSNKQFTYLLAGVPMVMSDTPAHRAFSLGLEGCIRLFRTDDPRSLALAMDELLGSPETLAAARRRAFELGQTRFNWETEQRVFLDAVARALGESI